MIVTKRLILRSFYSGDEQDLYEYLSDIAINYFKEMEISILQQAYNGVLERTKYQEYYFAIELKETGKVIGEIFAHPKSTSHDNPIYDIYSPC